MIQQIMQIDLFLDKASEIYKKVVWYEFRQITRNVKKNWRLHLSLRSL